tara:strand:+ start:357 stop:623 length:267 start_codon:yes stop_codon:yes gene_type:complete
MKDTQGEVSFLESLEQAAKRTSYKRRSKVDIILSELLDNDKEMYDEVTQALNEATKYSASNIALVLKNFGFSVSDSSVKRWRQQNLHE